MMPPQRDLAMAYGNLSFICMEADKTEEALAYGTRALELAQRLDDTEIFVQALTTIGLTELIAGAPEGRQKLERSLELAEKSGLEERVAEALLCLASAAVRQRSYPAANAYVAKGVAYCSEHGLELQRLYALAYRARSELDQGRWTESSESAALVLRVPSISTTPRILALVVVGLLRARRGDPGPWGPLDEALALAEPSGELKRIAPVAAARAEVAWLEGDHKAVAEATEAAFDLAVSRRAVRAIGELAYWRWRAGIREQVPPGGAKPFDLQIAGDWEGAAEYWAGIGCPYEAALARGDADDDGQLRRALDELQRLGARPAAAIVARRLRERGASGLPRGPRLATQRNPASLTGREVEVLALVAQGLRNADVAGRLFIAEKTVDHHVSAILRKLGLRTRRQASAEALRLGLVRQDR
jgi:DNA-binding CsgD family transcriptional regulator